MRHLPKNVDDPNLLVGLETADDAGVYKINDETALVQTLDFFTPIVDDAYMFGQIGAANALSDVYAMGGKPLTVMNIVAFPINTLDKSILADILAGASDKVKESGAALVGGHSIDDQEPKFGLSVTGTIHPDRIRSNAGAKPGDRLILTKPIGVGILTTAIKQGILEKEDLDEVMNVMATLNKTAAEVMDKFTVNACTDVTGFGLLGHTMEIAKGGNVGVTVNNHDVPVLSRAKELAAQNVIPGGTRKNRQWLADDIDYADSISEIDQLILCDAVTSGGLLISVPEAQADALQRELLENNVQSAIIGNVTSENAGRIQVI
ncbi:selenide, water dikinase SelD [Planococcus antarcticus DSM 14505]|uniref:Selenide, water dikinase n=1 Tax=Planococcus antarcticus DSM 14505 TaxID=1185653 RepID=A0ABM6D9U0_9BACL|nr:selenide, water dikinase SelD [Planococcus antarcticus DSM 14505]